ncbi:MAG: hypothetical protein E7417_04385 [Ruminococcaceae bacterium]|nr:hypothetical protein [Oscillospiraceae bacterium]
MKNRDTVDFHAHILPGMDHGSGSITTSRKQLDMAKAAGIKTICATSHFYPHAQSCEDFLEKRKKCFDNLKKVLKSDDPEIIPGAEVLVCDGLETMKGIEKLCLEGTNILLLEMPFMNWSRGVMETTENLCMRDDLTIVIAHADRYPKESIAWFIQNGIDLQLNIDAFKGLFRKGRYTRWVKNGYAKYLGSDIHHANKNPYYDWKKYSRLFK